MIGPSQIQAASSPATSPVSSISPVRDRGAGVFREAMQQAMGSKHGPVQDPVRRSGPVQTGPRTSSRKSETGVSQSSRRPAEAHSKAYAGRSTQSKSSTATASKTSPAASDPSSAAGESGSPAADPSASGQTASSTDLSLTGKPGPLNVVLKNLSTVPGAGTADPLAVQGREPDPGLNATGPSKEGTVAGSPGNGKRTRSREKDGRAGDAAQTAATAAVVSTLVPVLLHPAGPDAAPPGGENGPTSFSGKSPAAGDHGASAMALNFKTQQAGAAPTTAANLTGSGPLAAAPTGPAVASAASNAAGSPTETAAQGAATAAEMSTYLSSTDLLLSATDGTASAVHSSARSVDSDGVASGLGAAWANTVSSIAPDFAGKGPNGPADGHSKSTSVEAAAAAPAATGTPAMGNMTASHTGTPAAIGIAPSNGPSNAGDGRPSLTSSTLFAAMDRADTGANRVLLHAAPNQVAVGVSDPGLGWIEVRAERVAGQVTAALTANSTTSHAELNSVLPAMSSYLHDQRQAVQQIHVETGFAGQNPSGAQTGSGGQQHPGSRTPERLDGLTGIGAGERLASASGSQRGRPVVETNPRRSTAEGHQFSVRA